MVRTSRCEHGRILRGRKNLSHTDIGIVPYVTCTPCDMENNNFRPEEAEYLKTGKQSSPVKTVKLLKGLLGVYICSSNLHVSHLIIISSKFGITSNKQCIKHASAASMINKTSFN